MNLLKAFSAVSGLTLASRVTGLLREILSATWFGAGMQMDAFNVAFRAPNMLRRLFASRAGRFREPLQFQPVGLACQKMTAKASFIVQNSAPCACC